MHSLGTRLVSPEADTLESRIEARLTEALERQAAGGFYGSPDGSTRGMVAPDLEELGIYDCVIRLSMADVARIAAAEARAWF
jgi:hypothetical protein